MLLTELEKYKGKSPIADMCNDLSQEALLLLIKYTSKERLALFIARIPMENQEDPEGMD